jgi:O-antigen biosynthesis protein
VSALKIPAGFVLFEARLRESAKGPAALAASVSDGTDGTLPIPIFLGAARAGRNLSNGQALRSIELPGQTVETHLFTAGGVGPAHVALTATKCRRRHAILQAVRFFPLRVLQYLALAVSGQRRLGLLKLLYTLQSHTRPISYATWRAVFENVDLPAAGNGTDADHVSALGLIVIGNLDKSVRETLRSVAAMSERPLRWAVCTNCDFHEKLAELLDDPTITHIGAVAGGDRLSQDAVVRVLGCLRQTNAHLVYADHDRVDGAGRRHSPAFKPAWNKPLALTDDLLAGLAVVRKDLLRREHIDRVLRPIAAWRDVLLHVACRPGTRIAHIPHILCHLAENAQRYPSLHERCAIVNRIDASARLQASTTVVNGRIVRQVSPCRGSSVSIIIPTACKAGVADSCLPTILANTDYDRVEFLIVAHSYRFSEPHARDLLDRLRQDVRVRIVVHDIDPFNYSAVNNLGAKSARGEVICLLNDDVKPLRSDWLKLMLGELSDPAVGAVGARLLYPNGWVQHMGLVIGMMGRVEHWQRLSRRSDSGYMGRARSTQDVSAVTGACLMVRSELYRALNGLDEGFAISFNDVDFCLRLREDDWRIVLCAEAELTHNETASLEFGMPRLAQVVAEELTRFRSRWRRVMFNDPHFNPNLSLETAVGWALAVPPRDRGSRVTIVSARECCA